MKREDTGLLISEQNIKLNRSFFKEFLRLHGLNVTYRAPIPTSKTYNMYGELDTNYKQPVVVRCIYDEHPTQKTMRKLGWNTELAETSVVIHVPYDLEEIQAGGLFVIPSGLDKSEGRVFKVLRMSNIAIYPASITCELGPMLINTTEKSTIENFKTNNFNLLDDESDDYDH